MANWRVGGEYLPRHPESYYPGRVPLFVIQSLHNDGIVTFSHRFEGETELWGLVTTRVFDTLAWPEDVSVGQAALKLLQRIVDWDNASYGAHVGLASLDVLVGEARKLLGANDLVEVKADAGS